MPPVAEHAVVIGAGMGGLAAAKSVAPYFDKSRCSTVTRCPRDPMSAPKRRNRDMRMRFLPEARERSRLCSPGIGSELLKAGALKGRAGLAIRYEQPGFDPFPQRDLGFDAFFLSRPLLKTSAGGDSAKSPMSSSAVDRASPMSRHWLIGAKPSPFRTRPTTGPRMPSQRIWSSTLPGAQCRR